METYNGGVLTEAVRQRELHSERSVHFVKPHKLSRVFVRTDVRGSGVTLMPSPMLRNSYLCGFVTMYATISRMSELLCRLGGGRLSFCSRVAD